MSRFAPWALACLIAACGGDDDGSGGDGGGGDGGGEVDAGGAPTVEEDRLFTALNQADYAGLDDVIAGYAAANQAEPDDVLTLALLGSAHLWRVAEAGRDPATAQMVAQTHAPQVARYLGEAHERAPQQTFVAGLLGLSLWDAGTQTGDTGAQQQGAALVDQIAEVHPELGLFLRILAYQNLPRDDARFAVAVDSAWQWLDSCVGEPVDRTDPDLAPYFTPDRIAGWTGERRFCWETERVPNAAKGSFLVIGDVLVKQGEVAAGRVMYENATRVPGYDAWPHRDAIESRLAENLEERAAAYDQADPSAWPAHGKPPLGCTLCHQTR
jgi:hypothetical protein